MTPAEAASPLAAAASAAAIVATPLQGVPPTDVIAWSIIGGVVAVWLDRRAEVVVTPAWMINALMLIFVSAVAGLAISSAVIGVAQGTQTAWLEPLRHVPHWSLAAIVAAGVHKVGPILFRRALDRWQLNRGTPPGDAHGPN